jgi:hypothetical protein
MNLNIMYIYIIIFVKFIEFQNKLYNIDHKNKGT